MATGKTRIIQLADGSYATPDGRGGWAPYTGPVPGAKPADQGFKVGDTDAISHAWDIVDSINAARQLSQAPLSAGTRAEAIRNIPLVGGMVGQNRDNLQVKLGSIAGDLRQLAIHNLYEQTGSKGVGSIARSTSEQQALQSSLAPLGFVEQGGHAMQTAAAPDAKTLGQGLDVAQNIYLRHLARLYGANPDDPNVLATIEAGIGDPNKRQSLGAAFSNPGAVKAISGNEQAALNPAVDKIKGQLTTMLNTPKSKLSNAEIEDFVKQNNIDPSTWDSLQQALKKRDKTRFTVDPHYNKPITNPVAKGISELGASPIGAPVVGFGDVYTAGASPDIAGIVHGVTGLGPTRQDVITARDISAEEHPVATFAGNVLGGVANPLMRGGGLVRTAIVSGLYGGLGSSDPSVESRAGNALLAAGVGSLAHAGTNALVKGGQAGYRALRQAIAPIFGKGNEVADANALARAAQSMPPEDLANIKTAIADGKTPAAAALSPAGQEFLARVAGGSSTAKAIAQNAAKNARAAVPGNIGAEFDAAMDPATADFLNRPTREVMQDIHDMAGREYNLGLDPIKNDPVNVDQELADTLGHESVKPAIADVLRNSKLSTETRAVLRGLTPWIKDGMVGKIPITVDALRNLATNLDQRATKSGNIVLSDLAATMRDKIGSDFPEYKQVNDLYAARMRSLDALRAAREGFTSDNLESTDALAKASKNFTPAPNVPEYKGPTLNPSGPVLPSNADFAIAGARDAVVNQAGAGSNQGGANILRQIAEGANQQARNRMVLPGDAAANLEAAAGKQANAVDVLNKIANGPLYDQSGQWFRRAKYALLTKMTGGAAHYAVAQSLAGIPKLGANDAARVTQIFTNANSADQALQALTKAYGANTARNIMGRVIGLGSAGRATRDQPPLVPIGSPITLTDPHRFRDLVGKQ